jgi:phenylpropionate dioxygenase-like ring-hydroxylating dioxygenase large terminal subunit
VTAPDDPALFARLRETLFAQSWQLVAHESELGGDAMDGAVLPVTLLPGMLDEPLLLVRDTELRALSNACTHRGALVCEEAGAVAAGKTLRCRYQGRRFALDGRCLGAPGFDKLPEHADLPRVPLARWRGFLFASVFGGSPDEHGAARQRALPGPRFDELIADLQARTAWLPIERAVLDPTRSRDYDVAANWALYCDNFLEGFHVPFVHAGLVPALDLPHYRCETFGWSSVQVGIAPPGEPALEPPRGAPDHGQRIAGYYFWLFPSTLVNVYPWGISLNLLQPLAPDRTRVCFRSWVWDAKLLDRGAGADLHTVEMEDEAVVLSAQRGTRSRLWRAGAYASGHEDCVAHFHRLLAPYAVDAH